MRKKLRHGIKFIIFLLAIGVSKILTRKGTIVVTTTIIKADKWLLPKRAATLRKNIAAAFPHLTPPEHKALVKKARRNFALLAGEFLHLQDIRQDPSRIRVEGAQHVQAATHNEGGADKPVVFVGGHFSNWELMAQGVGALEIPISVLYRPEDNPIIANWTKQQRAFATTKVVHKERGGTRALIDSLRQGVSIALLCDQRKNDGIEIDFMGIPSLVPPAPAKIAQKFKLAIVPSVIRREERSGDPSYFVQHFFPAIYVENTGDADADIKKAVEEIYACYADWILTRPEEWYWYHNRWNLG